MQAPLKSAQFSLRQMILTVLACAFISAVAAPFLRQFSAERLLWMFATLGAAVATTAVGVVRVARKRQPLEAAAGNVLLHLGRPSRVARAIDVLLSGICVIFLAVWSLLGSGWMERVFPMAMAALWGLNFADGCKYAWWPALELCEHGILSGTRNYHQWNQVKCYAWGRLSNPSMLRLVLAKGAESVRTPYTQRPEVEAVLALKGCPHCGA